MTSPLGGLMGGGWGFPGGGGGLGLGGIFNSPVNLNYNHMLAMSPDAAAIAARFGEMDPDAWFGDVTSTPGIPLQVC